MTERQRRRLHFFVPAVVGPALAYFIAALWRGESFVVALGALAMPFVVSAVAWLIYWEATTPDDPSGSGGP